MMQQQLSSMMEESEKKKYIEKMEERQTALNSNEMTISLAILRSFLQNTNVCISHLIQWNCYLSRSNGHEIMNCFLPIHIKYVNSVERKRIVGGNENDNERDENESDDKD